MIIQKPMKIFYNILRYKLYNKLVNFGNNKLYNKIYNNYNYNIIKLSLYNKLTN